MSYDYEFLNESEKYRKHISKKDLIMLSKKSKTKKRRIGDINDEYYEPRNKKKHKSNKKNNI